MEENSPYKKNLIKIVIDKPRFCEKIKYDPSNPTKKREYETTVNGVKVITRWSERDQFYGTSRLEIGNGRCLESKTEIGAYENHKILVEELEDRMKEIN